MTWLLTCGGLRGDDQVVAAIIFGGAFTVAIVSIIATTIRKVLQSKHIEESRREIAAYVAEGSISPDDAARLLGTSPGKVRNGRHV